MTVDELLETPYWVIDILPKQVPAYGPGQYFAVERYYLEKEQFAAIKRRHVNVILKLNCYQRISLDEGASYNPSPECVATEMLAHHLCIMVGDDALIVSEPDDTAMAAYNVGEELLELLMPLAASEGLFVWRPPTGL